MRQFELIPSIIGHVVREKYKKKSFVRNKEIFIGLQVKKTFLNISFKLMFKILGNLIYRQFWAYKIIYI